MMTYFNLLGNKQVLMNILSTRGVLGQGACLDALIAIMLDSSANQAVDIFSFDLLLTEVV